MKKILTLMLAAVLVLSSITPVLAENKYQDQQTPDDTLKDVDGGTVTFNKYFITKQGAVVPTVEFSFTIEAVSTGSPAVDPKWTYNGTDYASEQEAKDAVDQASGSYSDIVPTPGKFEILKPTDPNVSGSPAFVTNADKAKFGSNSATYTSVQFGDKVHLDTNEQYSKAEVSLDFTGVTFFEPGVYRYVIKETKPATPALTGLLYDTQTNEAYVYDSDNDGTPDKLVDPSANVSTPIESAERTRYLDIYVTDNQGSLTISSTVLHELAAQPETNGSYGTGDVNSNNDPLADKSDGFVNEYHTVDLSVKKEVSGNQASKDKYFAVTVKVDDAVDNINYVVSFANDGNSNTNDGNCDATSGTNAATIPTNAGIDNYDGGTGAAAKWTFNSRDYDSEQAAKDAVDAANNNGGSYAYDDITYTAADPYTVTGANLKTGKTFYLQHGQYIVIRDLPAGSNYTVTENAEDYKSEAAALANYMNATSGKLSEVDEKNRNTNATEDPDGIVYTSFLNTRQGVIPTGVLMSITGGAALIALAGAGIFFLNRKKDEEED